MKTPRLAMDGSTESRYMGFVGMPRAIHLGDFVKQVRAAFGGNTYLVGSATQRKDWHDLDIATIIPDDQWQFGDPANRFASPKWRAMVAAFALLGEKMTGATVDFQLYPATYDKQHFKGPRILIES